jgi:UDP-GlcNAc:undecaprenyl-phosphate GlcNAc-1-phosphate transferase
VLAATSIKINTKSGTAVAMAVPVIALGLPIMDTLLAMARRALLGRPMFSADKEHIHHRLMSRLVMSHRSAVLALYGLCCLFALTALGLSYANSAQSAMLLLAVSIVVVVVMRKLGYLSLQRTAEVTETRKRNLQLRTVVREISEKLGRAESEQDVWEAVRPLADQLETGKLELRLEKEGEGHHDGMLMETERPHAGSAYPVGLRLSLHAPDKAFGSLSLTWRDGRGEVNRDEELALEILAEVVSATLQRLDARTVELPRRVASMRK